MEIQAIRIRQDGQALYITAMPAGDLVTHSKPDKFRIENGIEHGYQREPERARALKMANFLQRAQVLLPTAIILGVRCKLDFDEKSGTLHIPDEEEIFEVDGQHRAAGFRVAINERGIQRLADMPLVAVIIEDTNETTEAEQFRIINETAKKVRTDLARRILTRAYHTAPISLRREAVMERRWEVRATEVMQLIQHDETSPFHERIQSPNQRKTAFHTIKEQSFGDSLRPLLTSHPFEDYNSETIEKGLNEFWGAWKKIMDDAPDKDDYPHPFDEPSQFVLLKAIPGVFSLHLVCRYLWSVFERRGQRFNAYGIEEAIKLAGSKVFDQKYEDFTTRGIWTGEDGHFANYGGLKGAGALARLIIEYLKEAGYILTGPEPVG